MKGMNMIRAILRRFCVFLFCIPIYFVNVSAQVDNCGYPDKSNPPRSLVRFQDAGQVTRIGLPGTVVGPASGESLKLWYSGQHAMTLGVRKIEIKEGRNKSSISSPVSEMTVCPGSVLNPQFGSTPSSDDASGIDREGRPISPVLYITDVTSDASNREGDWQHGGIGLYPHSVYGAWKAAVKKINRGEQDTHIQFDPDRDPHKNGWNLGEGSDQPPDGTKDKGFGTECVWYIDNLGLLDGHTYRLQFMVHGGELQKSGSEAIEECATITIAPTFDNCTISPLIATILDGDSVIFTATPSGGVTPFHFLWNTGETTQSITARVAGRYAVTIVDRFGRTTFCQASLDVGLGANIAREKAPEYIGPVPTEYKLGQNYPNPFNPETTVPFDIPEESAVRITVYNLLGQMVASLLDDKIGAGYHTVVWNTESNLSMPISSGVYLYRIQASSLVGGKYYSQVRKLLFLR